MKRRTWLIAAALTASAFLAANATSQTFIQSWINQFMQYLNRQTLALPYAPPPDSGQWQSLSATERLASTRSRLLPKLHDELAAKQLKLGQPAFIRIFKESRELELWLKNSTGWQLFRTYPIATFSGTLGPKTREGDMQAPEGFYSVTSKQLNPASSYHLSFNIGYPNAYDLAHQRTGSLIMVHGDTVSIGCFAMTDPLIEEIYLVVEAALKNMSTVPVHCFPFRMTGERLQKEQASPHLDFWQNLRPAHDLFEKERRVPQVTVKNDRYQAR
ncbi:MAG TPA: 2-dehydro-3-deoxyphosphooctonate aldolase [Verrucomicrobiales bacterium]|nr:2-dehydro-3-deoxyphosphooctonate aldolase [Verrucomicrobiales bacterium]